MNNIEPRLVRCFTAVFPSIQGPQITSASTETVEGWDSVATATLVTAIEEEFSIEFDTESLSGLTSFAAIRDYLMDSYAHQ